ncbi:ORF6N domain-containing protein [Tangfeifania diversioriginum]|uniref:ORF6N domain-containing protein n=2 Tax=Tangfeifania diversioriginum TaxID=1168035 RepID=A0A1M6JJU2_9BACT|nr:ORF6N domain-containing protein [Tangfeifania diversioriginum]
MSKEVSLSHQYIESRIFNIRNAQVMIDRDLAEMYQVEVKRLNEQVKRNNERFPSSFRFQLNETEKKELVANCDRFDSLKHSSVNPYAFTEQGVAMLSSVLRSDIAIKVSIQIINAFVRMRKIINENLGLLQRMEGVEKKQIETDQKFERIFKALESKAFNKSHDRFLIIDESEVYHLGASLKDLGKKWFAFSKLDINSVENILKAIEKKV